MAQGVFQVPSSLFWILCSTIICHFMHEYISRYIFQDISLLPPQRHASVSRSANVSSVWCHSIDSVLRCNFKNLCYAAKENQFIFFLTGESVISGVNMKEIKSLPVSSVANHNLLSINLAVVSNRNAILNRHRINHGSIFLLWRFKWDNIMHVLHDDLIPLFFTYASLCTDDIENCIRRYRLGFVDGGDAGELAEWYRVFSNSDPLFLHQERSDNLICFDEAQTGLLRSSSWFQYGFGRPQGPLGKKYINQKLMYQFTNYIFSRFDVQKNHNVVGYKPVLLFSRRLNRRILNEDHLKTMIMDSYHSVIPETSKLLIISLDVAANDTKSILSAVHSSDIMVGMHGSAMIFSLFLSPGSVVVELFPFGIIPQYVSPIKAWAETEGSGIIYKSWENMKEFNSFPHPDAPPLLGGIHHLPVAEQMAIKNAKLVPAVECCHNSLYLYRIFQDTVVDLDFSKVFKQALLEKHKFSLENFTENYSNREIMLHYFPAPVSNIICSFENRKLVISWQPPINININSTLYKVAVVSNKDLQFTTESSVPNITVPLQTTLLGNVDFDIWIKSVAQKEESTDVYAKCHIHMP
ncbi:protein O-linked-mannose beta-1,4-N-acetylglucosaminyltransferase 2 [Anabrus simplex]|uniref:protein O-linked-mannose beta-1,4-N-acetylglucosaminyltransferase 2 n=1 Tax=Anabrus simplex TaxID=316456 RepID=UPI0035A30D15